MNAPWCIRHSLKRQIQDGVGMEQATEDSEEEASSTEEDREEGVPPGQKKKGVVK